MEEKYYAVVRSGSNDDLTHWKYVKRVRKNGKWQYYYDASAKSAKSITNKYAELKEWYDREYDKFYNKMRDDDTKNAKTQKEKRDLRKYNSQSYREEEKPYFNTIDPVARELDRSTKKLKKIIRKRSGNINRIAKEYIKIKKPPKLNKPLKDSSSAIDKGKKKVSELLNKSGKKLIKLSEDIVK